MVVVIQQGYSFAVLVYVRASHQYHVGKAMDTTMDHSSCVVLKCVINHHPYNVALCCYCLHCLGINTLISSHTRLFIIPPRVFT